MNFNLEYSTRVVQEGGRRCKKSTLNDLVPLTTLRIPLMNPPILLRWMAASDRETPCMRQNVETIPESPLVNSLL